MEQIHEPNYSNIPLSQLVNTVISWNNHVNLGCTLLGIGPMSTSVIESSIELGKEKSFPVIFIASRNQIDNFELGGGYVSGWDQKKFVKIIDEIAEGMGFRGLIYKCRDHGGPWQRDEEKNKKLREKEAMETAKASFLEDLKAGFDLVHVDCTKDPYSPTPLPLEVVIERTVDIIDYLEKERQNRKISPIAYEVGTEEISGGITSIKKFEKFITDLKQKLEARKLRQPLFIVGQTGTLVKMQKNVGQFNTSQAQQLAKLASRHGLGFKEHNADYLEINLLSQHPNLGITAANVAPEFGAAETKSYLQLAKEEMKLHKCGKLKQSSNITSILQNGALECGRWKKWLPKKDVSLTREQIVSDEEKLKEVTETCGHYIFGQDNFIKAHQQLTKNLQDTATTSDPEKTVSKNIKQCIDKYVKAFRLEGLNARLFSVLSLE